MMMTMQMSRTVKKA